MAKILFTAVVADMRGKIAGTVFSKNAAGAFARTKVSPVNRQSPAQQAARNRLSQLSATWRTLTNADRASWRAQAVNAEGTNVFGNTKTLTGQQLFVGVNSNFAMLGQGIALQATQSDSPAFTGTLSIGSSVNASQNMDALQLVAAGVTGDNVVFAVQATAPLSPGISNADGRYRSIGYNLPTATTTNGIAAYTAKFGPARTGQKIFMKFTPLNVLTGRSGADIILQFLVGSGSFAGRAFVADENGELVSEAIPESGRKSKK